MYAHEDTRALGGPLPRLSTEGKASVDKATGYLPEAHS